MLKTGQTTCLIPFYNEGSRIFSVLDVVTQIQEISQIICIDDGSTDDTTFKILKSWPNIEVVRLPENQGKTAAIRHGLHMAVNDFILLMDADLQCVNPSEIINAIHAMQQNTIDMIILRRINAPWFVKMDRGDVLFSGERIMKRKDLADILQKQICGYQLEIAINNYMLENKKEVYWAPSSAYNTYKVKKLGLLLGFIKELNMFFDIIFFAGLQNYVRQITTFARKRWEVLQTKETKSQHEDQMYRPGLSIKQANLPVQQNGIPVERQTGS